MTDGSILSFASDLDKINSIPPMRAIQKIDFANIKWILIIEKEVRFFAV